MNLVTRYLCSSVYTNAAFRNLVLTVYREKYKIIAQSFGVDQTALFEHALNAERRSNRNNRVLFVATLIIAWFTLVGGLASPGLYAGAIFVYMLAVLFMFKRELFEQLTILRYAFKETDHSSEILNLTDAQKQEVQAKHKQIAANLVYYGGFNPFVGSGDDVGSWSFTVDTDKGKKELGIVHEPQDFDTDDLYDHVAENLIGLNFKKMKISGKAFINGKSIRNNQLLLPNQLMHPVNTAEDSFIKDLMHRFEDGRYYSNISVYDWEDELILNIYLRFCKNKKNLFIEANYFVLPAIHAGYKGLDYAKPNLKFLDYTKLFFKVFVSTALQCLGSLFSVAIQVYNAWQKAIYGDLKENREYRKLVRDNPKFNYGANHSIRELVSSGHYDDLFQKLDKEMYVKTIEKRILSSVMDFLSEKNIDVSEFKEREMNILNNGVLMTGGTIRAQNIAVGSKAKSKSTQTNK